MHVPQCMAKRGKLKKSKKKNVLNNLKWSAGCKVIKIEIQP